MDKFSRTTLLFLLFCVLIILQFQPATLDEGGQNVAQEHPEKPLLSKLLMDTVSLLRKSHKSSWEKIKTVIHDLQMQFSPPNLEGGGEAGHDGAKGTMKEAVGESFHRSKETVEESAKSAAKVVGEAFHKTTEKMKDSTDTEKESEAEL
ncbi:uncharacterized protein LOC133289930 [Gastrolobium bilobum]|uniref:uncharacterized protein LOC133289930 n=1 Tax=Gastrolobium bilobum TaxID=150636 RepID=UPI002AAF4997|nr:uncharacterized protein LOC133289930 [Gastrolobium bilobum]